MWILGIADYESVVSFEKLKMADSKWRMRFFILYTAIGAILDPILLNIKNLIRHLGSAILNFTKLTWDLKSATIKPPIYLIWSNLVGLQKYCPPSCIRQFESCKTNLRFVISNSNNPCIPNLSKYTWTKNVCLKGLNKCQINVRWS